MAVGLLGLVGFQLYWISNAFRLQQEQFDYKVTDALQEVVRTLERQEILYLTRQRIQAREHQQRLMAIGKKEDQKEIKKEPSINKKEERVVYQAPRRDRWKGQPSYPEPGRLMPGGMVPPSDVLHQTVQPLTAEQMMIVEQFFRQQEELMATGNWQAQLEQQQRFEEWIDQIVISQLQMLNSQVGGHMPIDADTAGEAVSYRTSKPVRRPKPARPVKPAQSDEVVAPAKPATVPVASAGQRKTEEQSQMIKDVLKGLLLSDRPIEERLNRMTLDTLLKQALQERGIGIPYAYAVRTKNTPSPAMFLFTSMGAEPDQFEQRGYKTALFPNNLLETGNYVYIYFPTQQQYILDRMGFAFAGSAVLILVIMACFYIAITTILRQKKLADIKNDFINNMTHEFKTPISTISLAVELAQEQLNQPGATQPGEIRPDAAQPAPEPSRLLRYMGIIRDENRRLGSHVEKVLQMALLDRGQVKLKLAQVNIHDVIEKVLNNAGLQIEQRQGEVELDFEAQHEVVEADEVHLTNIIYNLLDNAIKYSPEQLHITIRTRSLAEGVSITVADKGIGLTKEQMSRIFEQFYRVPTGNLHDVKGFGLGLSYVKRMVDEHHGQIQVESWPGQGSSFEVLLPYLQAHVQSDSRDSG
ncbi:hypothetical protein GCM10023189_53460 [Nibrella saemangeumensis]|uniref:histidine kinase n=2 Tax=Nibrella saemangeumensis TaxID=1084526 RepID=A0ABP8NJM0_9BACT